MIPNFKRGKTYPVEGLFVKGDFEKWMVHSREKKLHWNEILLKVPNSCWILIKHFSLKINVKVWPKKGEQRMKRAGDVCEVWRSLKNHQIVCEWIPDRLLWPMGCKMEWDGAIQDRWGKRLSIFFSFPGKENCLRHILRSSYIKFDKNAAECKMRKRLAKIDQ